MFILVVTVGIIQIIFWTYWLVTAIRNRSAYKRRQSGRAMLPIILALVLIWGFIGTRLSPGLTLQRVVPDGVVPGLIGILITILGLGFAVWARVHLGRNWSSRPGIKVDHKLIRTGPYRFVRNPIYTGILIGYAGTAVVIGELWAFVLILFVLVAFLGKIYAEEKFLLEEFGDAYLQYRREVKALIPYLL